MVDYLSRRGWAVLRVNPTSLTLPTQVIQSGIPDTLAFRKIGHLFQLVFIEVKQKGKKPRRLQSFIAGLLEKVGVTTLVFDGDFDQLKKDIDSLPK